MQRIISRLGVMMTLAGGAMANTYDFTPTPRDAGDLAHQYLYTWGLQFSLPQGERITGASLSFDNLNNWDNNYNVLSFDLLDSAIPTVKKVTETTTQVIETLVTVTRVKKSSGGVVSSSTQRQEVSRSTQTAKAETESPALGTYEGSGNGVLLSYQDNTGDNEWIDEILGDGLVQNEKLPAKPPTVVTKKR